MTGSAPIIAFLACKTTMPGRGERRGDAYESDLMTDAISQALADHGLEMRIVDWEADLAEFDGVSLALLGSSWNYQDKPQEFIAKLDALEARGIQLCNSAEIVRWNARKTYLRELADKGAATIPTIWLDDVSGDDVMAAIEAFDCERLVVKRQIGAGAEGQEMFARTQMPDTSWRFGHKAMLQPFLPTIQSEGELSFIFIQGELSHALCKKAAEGEYRIQSLYGGTESHHSPSDDEAAQAQKIIAALPFSPPLYARIDMVRGERGQLLLMEAEMIEPYLYPVQGPELGPRIASAITNRLAEKVPAS